MKLRTEYLSYEELKNLISEIEESDMVAAPPDAAEYILSEVTGKTTRLKHKECHEYANSESDLSMQHRKKEYRSYCFRVWTSVAAAVAMIFLFSKVVSLQPVQGNQVERHDRKSVFALFSESNYIFGGEDKFNVFKGVKEDNDET